MNEYMEEGVGIVKVKAWAYYTIIMSIIGDKNIEYNASIIGTNCQHNQQNLRI